MVDTATATSRELRYLAFYLPQFHPIPENDVWWGRGFTEWTNVVQASPLYEEHHQPHLPGELGYYDLRLPETRLAQADLARSHGIDGFVYYHYWFSGRRLLERPFNEVLHSGSPDFPFALCWANEPWTSHWNGRDATYLIQQAYSASDDEQHIRYLIDAFQDPRYIHVEGRPLLLVYSMRSLPEPLRMVDRFAEACRRADVPRPWIVRCDTFLDTSDPASVGADAACDFPPHGAPGLARVEHRDTPVPFDLIDYAELATAMARRAPTDWIRYPTVVPSWDNSARRRFGGGMVLRGANPERYEEWLSDASRRISNEVDDAIVFVNAWNEWAEGAHLEPDQLWGRQYLEATLRARRTVEPGFEPALPLAEDAPSATPIDALYADLSERYRDLEREATAKFEAGQAALRSTVTDREREIALLRDQARRQRAWGEQLLGDLLKSEAGPAAMALRAELEAVQAELEALRAQLEQRERSLVNRVRRSLAASRWSTPVRRLREIRRGRP